MSCALMSQFTEQWLKLNPCIKSSEAPGRPSSPAVSLWPHGNKTPILESLTSLLFRRHWLVNISCETGEGLVPQWTCGTFCKARCGRPVLSVQEKKKESRSEELGQLAESLRLDEADSYPFRAAAHYPFLGCNLLMKRFSTFPVLHRVCPK